MSTLKSTVISIYSSPILPKRNFAQSVIHNPQLTSTACKKCLPSTHKKFSSRSTMFEHHEIINLLWLLIFEQDSRNTLALAGLNFTWKFMDVTPKLSISIMYHELLSQYLTLQCQLLTINILSIQNNEANHA